MISYRIDINEAIVSLITLIYTSAWARGSVVFSDKFQLTVNFLIFNKTQQDCSKETVEETHKGGDVIFLFPP